jgi:hypothetical protein
MVINSRTKKWVWYTETLGDDKKCLRIFCLKTSGTSSYIAQLGGTRVDRSFFFYFAYSGGVESKLGPLGTAPIYCPIVPAPGDCEDGELFGGMKIDRGNRSTGRKRAPPPLCPPQIPLDQTRDRTRAAAVGSQRLTASAMARPLGRRLLLNWNLKDDIMYAVGQLIQACC